jgi:hypothetical protein
MQMTRQARASDTPKSRDWSVTRACNHSSKQSRKIKHLSIISIVVQIFLSILYQY